MSTSLRRGEDGQFDGDKPRSFGFQGSPRFAQQGGNALGAQIPPWHMWGNTQRITTPVQSPTNPLTFTPGQLLRVAYKRPETWHWVLQARLIDGVDADVVDSISVNVNFDLTIGIGRAIIQIPATSERDDRPFERFRFVWGGPTVGIQTTFPRNASLYSTAVVSNRILAAGLVPDPATAIVVDQIVAQDIQLNCRVQAVGLPGSPYVGAPITIEVSAHFSPKTHVRPDWFRDGAEAVQYGGGEVEGK